MSRRQAKVVTIAVGSLSIALLLASCNAEDTARRDDSPVADNRKAAAPAEQVDVPSVEPTPEPEPPVEPTPIEQPPPAARPGCPEHRDPPALPKSRGGVVLYGRTIGKRPKPTGPTVPPKIRTGRATVGPKFSKEVLRRIMRRIARPPIMDCYRAALEQCPDLAGKLVVTFSVDFEGKLSKVALDGPKLHPPVDACVLKNIRALTFPGDYGGMNIKYPFYFIPTRDLSKPP